MMCDISDQTNLLSLNAAIEAISLEVAQDDEAAASASRNFLQLATEVRNIVKNYFAI